jgi:hypothetical protein
MIRFRISLRAIPYFAIILLYGETAYAAPILLREFTHTWSAFRAGPTPAAVPFRFSASSNPSTHFIWDGNYAPSDVGITVTAPLDVLAGANEAIHSSTAGFQFAIAEISFQSYGPVPPFAYFPSHTLTSVERIIDRLVITGFQNVNYTVEATQRIQFLGVPVPEPSTVTLVLLTLGVAKSVR